MYLLTFIKLIYILVFLCGIPFPVDITHIPRGYHSCGAVTNNYFYFKKRKKKISVILPKSLRTYSNYIVLFYSTNCPDLKYNQFIIISNQILTLKELQPETKIVADLFSVHRLTDRRSFIFKFNLLLNISQTFIKNCFLRNFAK